MQSPTRERGGGDSSQVVSLVSCIGIGHSIDVVQGRGVGVPAASWGLCLRGIERPKAEVVEHQDLMEVIEERHGRRSTLIASQMPVEQWHELIGEATLADAILDRLLHGAHRLELRGESMRKLPPPGGTEPADDPATPDDSVTA